MGVVADLTVEQEVDVLHAAVGDVDVVVNNAGMFSVGSPDVMALVSSFSLADWRNDIARNLDTAFLVTRRFLPAMVERGWGRIVNVASTTGPVNAMPEQAAYAAAKSGMVGLTRAVAVEVASLGVTCNAVAPGWIAGGGGGDGRLPGLARLVLRHQPVLPKAPRMPSPGALLRAVEVSRSG